MNRRAFLAALPALPAAAVAVARTPEPLVNTFPYVQGYMQEWPITVDQDDHFLDAANYLRVTGHYDGLRFLADEPK